MNDPALLDKETDEQLLENLENLNYQIDDLTDEATAIREVMLHRLKEKGINSKVVGDWTVSEAKRLSFPGVKLEQARELGATKEAVDNEALKKLHNAGALTEGVLVTTYLMVRKAKEKE